jgi:hypothetical protein
MAPPTAVTNIPTLYSFAPASSDTDWILVRSLIEIWKRGIIFSVRAEQLRLTTMGSFLFSVFFANLAFFQSRLRFHLGAAHTKPFTLVYRQCVMDQYHSTSTTRCQRQTLKKKRKVGSRVHPSILSFHPLTSYRIHRLNSLRDTTGIAVSNTGSLKIHYTNNKTASRLKPLREELVCGAPDNQNWRTFEGSVNLVIFR